MPPEHRQVVPISSQDVRFVLDLCTTRTTVEDLPLCNHVISQLDRSPIEKHDVDGLGAHDGSHLVGQMGLKLRRSGFTVLIHHHAEVVIAAGAYVPADLRAEQIRQHDLASLGKPCT